MGGKLEVLFLSRWYPYPADNGSKIRIFHLLAHLARRHTVDLVAFTDHPPAQQERAEMQQRCRRVETLPYPQGDSRPAATKLRALAGLFSALPRSVGTSYSPEMQRLVERLGRQNEYGLVIASQIDMAPYALILEGRPLLFEEIELAWIFEKHRLSANPLQKLRGRLMGDKYRRYFSHLLPRFAGITVASEREASRLRRWFPQYSSLQVIPNGVDLKRHCIDFGLAPRPGELIFSGSLSYGSNFDAVAYFLKDIFPLIRAGRPAARLLVTGALEGVDLRQLPHSNGGSPGVYESLLEGVHFTGYLEDIRPTVQASWASVVPLRRGGGTRLKILESLALGTPVVATSKGVEGLDLLPGLDVLVADAPQAFARAVLRLLGDSSLRKSLQENGRRRVAETYDWAAIGPKFCDYIESIAR